MSVAGVEAFRLEHEAVGVGLALQPNLGERRPLVGRDRLLADKHDRLGIAVLAQQGRERPPAWPAPTMTTPDPLMQLSWRKVTLPSTYRCRGLHTASRYGIACSMGQMRKITAFASRRPLGHGAGLYRRGHHRNPAHRAGPAAPRGWSKRLPPLEGQGEARYRSRRVARRPRIRRARERRQLIAADSSSLLDFLAGTRTRRTGAAFAPLSIQGQPCVSRRRSKPSCFRPHCPAPGSVMS